MKIAKIPVYLIQLFLFLIPVFFLPITRDFFDFNKNFLLMVFALVLMALFLAKVLFHQRLVFKISPLDLPVLIFLLTVVLSLIIVTPNKIDSLVNPGGIGTFLALFLIYFFLRQFNLTKKEIFYPLVASAALLGLFAAFQLSGLLDKLPVSALYKNKLFTPAGSSLSLISFLVICLIIASVDLYKQNESKFKLDYKNILLVVLAFFVLAGIAASSFLMAKKENHPIVLPYNFGWSIAAETLKKPLNALFGIGVGNYVSAFTQYKPVEINQKDIWSLRFSSSSDFFLQILTELGILGFGAFIYLLYKLFKSKLGIINYIYLVITLLILIFIPANILLIFVFFLLLSHFSQKTSKLSFVFPKVQTANEKEFLVQAFEEKNTVSTNSSQVVFVAIPLFAVILFGFYLVGRAYKAEVLISKGIIQAGRGNAQLTYDFEREAVVLNPNYSPYRLIFAQTNFALANLVALKKDLTDNDKQTLTQLVTQSINNAKIAINLNPSTIAWENLAEIYKRLINVSPDTANWSATAYNQALTFDPANPVLRISFGQLYYGVQAYDLAIRQFETAAVLKDDFANAWYNLANAERQRGNIKQSRAAYEKTLTLVDQGTNDYDRVKAEMEALPKEPETPVTQTSLETLTSPASPSAQIKQEVNLKQAEVAPEVSVTPAPITTESATELSPTPSTP